MAPAILGTLLVVGTTALMALPIGIAAAVYLEEYADHTRWFNRMFELNIQNLAAVPSVIFGILVLAFVVRAPLNIGAVALSGSVALALLVLPVIISTREAPTPMSVTAWENDNSQFHARRRACLAGGPPCPPGRPH